MAQFDVSAARAAGYSDDEILSHLTQSRHYDVQAAMKAGYSKPDIIAYLSSAPPAAVTPPIVPGMEKLGGTPPGMPKAPEPRVPAEMADLYDPTFKEDFGFMSGPMSGINAMARGVVRMSNPSGREKAGGAHEIITGAGQAATPFIGPSIVSSPLRTLLPLGTGLGAQELTAAGLEKLGVPQEYANVLGDLVGLRVGSVVHGNVPKAGAAAKTGATAVVNAAGSVPPVVRNTVGVVYPRAGQALELLAALKERLQARRASAPAPEAPVVGPTVEQAAAAPAEAAAPAAAPAGYDAVLQWASSIPDAISPAMIQRQFGVSYAEALRYADKLRFDGVKVGRPPIGELPARTVPPAEQPAPVVETATAEAAPAARELPPDPFKQTQAFRDAVDAMRARRNGRGTPAAPTTPPAPQPSQPVPAPAPAPAAPAPASEIATAPPAGVENPADPAWQSERPMWGWEPEASPAPKAAPAAPEVGSAMQKAAEAEAAIQGNRAAAAQRMADLVVASGKTLTDIDAMDPATQAQFWGEIGRAHRGGKKYQPSDETLKLVRDRLAAPAEKSVSKTDAFAKYFLENNLNPNDVSEAVRLDDFWNIATQGLNQAGQRSWGAPSVAMRDAIVGRMRELQGVKGVNGEGNR